MSMRCTHCNQDFVNGTDCPTCHIPLVYFSPTIAQRSSWEHTTLGRVFVGILLGQGLAYGLQMLCSAGLLVITQDGSNDPTASLQGTMLLVLLQGLGLLIAGALAGAGQENGSLLGALVGIFNGLLLLWLQIYRYGPANELILYGQPVLHTFFGCAGGRLGVWFWKPLPKVQLAQAPGPKKKKVAQPWPLFDGPISWIRMLLGAGVAIAGLFWSTEILNLIIRLSMDQFFIESMFQMRFLTWQIIVMLAVLGGAVAGSSSFNGLKQGLATGITANLIIVGILMNRPDLSLEEIVFTALVILGATFVGGWFGCKLFPPVVARLRKVSAY